MPDDADITGNNDFTEEKLRAARNRTVVEVKRGFCLYCKAEIKPDPLAPDLQVALYCDDDCKSDFEREQMIKKKTNRMLNNPGNY